MNNYPVEPLMADKLKENLQKYYPNEENIKELYNLIQRYGMYICCDKMKEFKIGDKVRIKDAMDISYIGKIGIIEEISSHEPFSVKLNIDGKEGSWACAWLFSQIELI